MTLVEICRLTIKWPNKRNGVHLKIGNTFGGAHRLVQLHRWCNIQPQIRGKSRVNNAHHIRDVGIRQHGNFIQNCNGKLFKKLKMKIEKSAFMPYRAADLHHHGDFWRCAAVVSFPFLTPLV